MPWEACVHLWTPAQALHVPSDSHGTIKTPDHWWRLDLPPPPTWEAGGQGQAIWGPLVPSAQHKVAAGVAALLGLRTWDKKVPTGTL